MPKKSQAKFILYFLVAFILLFCLMYSVGWVPDSIKQNNGDSLRTLWDKAQKIAIDKQLNLVGMTAENPTRIVIDKIGVDVTISNPNTTNVATLDEYLKQGAVRYPGSGLLGQGNMFIFAHSAEAFVIINNLNLKAFNGLKNLSSGDVIMVYSESNAYIYKVTSVKLVDKNQALVKLDNSKNMLTLSTCNTLGAPSERYVVEADYISTQ